MKVKKSLEIKKNWQERNLKPSIKLNYKLTKIKNKKKN